MNIYTSYRFRIKQFILILGLFLIGIVSAQNTLEKQSFETLSHYIDHHTKSDSLYFDYLKTYENKAQETGDLEKLFYVKSKYIVHSSSFEIRLKHAEEFLDLAKQQNNQRYIGLAKNKLALVYYMERDLEQSLHYELLAEEQLSQTDDLYNLNKSRYGIGAIYYFLGEYDKALVFFTQAADYYKNQNSYNDLRGHLNSIRYMGRCYYNLHNYIEVDNILKIGFEQTEHLRLRHKELNEAYFSLLKAQNLWAQKQFRISLREVQKALPIIKNNDDFANEHLAYLYIGKNLLGLNQSEEALAYFKKIDDLYINKQYSDLNLLEAYDYLITFFKNSKNIELQLFYTEQLLKVNKHLQQEYKGLSSTLQTKYENRKLETSRRELLQALNNQKKKRYFIIGLGSLLALGAATYLFMVRKKAKVLDSQNKILTQKQLFTGLDTKHILVLNTQPFYKENLKKTTIPYNKPPHKQVLSEEKTQELLEKLSLFEKEYRYLTPNITITSLAKEFDTNAKYLSEVINTSRHQNFTNYLNRLRIIYAKEQLCINKKLQLMTIQALAEEFGFNTARSFSEAFLKYIGIKLSFYISQLKND